MFSKGVSLTPPVNASLISVLEAVLNPLWVFLALGERPGNFALLGAVFPHRRSGDEYRGGAPASCFE